MSNAETVNARLDQILEAAGTLFLGTVDGDKPAMRPVSFKMFANDTIYLGVGTHKDVYRQIQANPNIQLVGCAGADWARVDAVAVPTTNRELVARAFQEADYLNAMYTKENGLVFSLLALTQGRAEFVTNMMEKAQTLEF